MTPGLRYFTAPCTPLNFRMRCCHFLSVCIWRYVCMCVCSCLFNHHTAPFLCKHNIYPHAWRPETPVAYEVAMATVEMHSGLLPRSWGPTLCCSPRRECWENWMERVRGWEDGRLGINCVWSIVVTQLCSTGVVRTERLQAAQWKQRRKDHEKQVKIWKGRNRKSVVSEQQEAQEVFAKRKGSFQELSGKYWKN